MARYKNTVDQEITNTPKKVRGVNMPKDIPAITPKATDTITTKIADKVVSKAADKAPATAKEVIKKVVAKSAPLKSELDTMKSSNPALRRQFADNSRLAQTIRSSDYGNDEDEATQARIDEAADFFKKRGVGATTKLAKGGAVSLKPITGKTLKPLSSKSITQAAAGMKKAVKPVRPAKGFATGGNVKCSKSSKAIDGCAKKGLTRAARAK